MNQYIYTLNEYLKYTKIILIKKGIVTKIEKLNKNMSDNLLKYLTNITVLYCGNNIKVTDKSLEKLVNLQYLYCGLN